MDINRATETAYKNGYNAGKKEAQAEIERYKRVVGELTIGKDGETAILLDTHKTEYIKKDLHKTFMNMARKQARTEAIKEFAEQVKMAFYYEFDELIPSIMADRIDNLVKEMVGENNG